MIIAYTIKGHRLPTQGHPQNHSSLLTIEQYEQFATELGMDPSSPWQRFDTDSAPGALCATTAERLRREPVTLSPPPAVPVDTGRTPSGTSSTQAALGRVLLDLSRQAPDAAKRVVTVSPDVSSTTNLAGWLNKVGVWSPNERRNWFDDDPETIMHWRERPTGQHMELGIAETNLVGLIGELGATWSRWGEPSFRSAWSTTHSWNVPWNRGPTAFTQADSRFWSGHPRVCRSRPRAAHISPSRHRRSALSNLVASVTSRHLPSMSSGRCCHASV